LDNEQHLERHNGSNLQVSVQLICVTSFACWRMRMPTQVNDCSCINPHQILWLHSWN